MVGGDVGNQLVGGTINFRPHHADTTAAFDESRNGPEGAFGLVANQVGVEIDRQWKSLHSLRGIRLAHHQHGSGDIGKP